MVHSDSEHAIFIKFLNITMNIFEKPTIVAMTKNKTVEGKIVEDLWLIFILKTAFNVF